MTLWQMPALTMLVGYLLGSIPFGIILTRLAARAICAPSAPAISARPMCCAPGARGWRRRRCCSISARGRWRCGSARRCWGADPLVNGGAMAGVMAFIGHCYPVWLRFKGGKGVATMMGVVPGTGLAAGADLRERVDRDAAADADFVGGRHERGALRAFRGLYDQQAGSSRPLRRDGADRAVAASRERRAPVERTGAAHRRQEIVAWIRRGSMQSGWRAHRASARSAIGI
jgi:hypothetical protein